MPSKATRMADSLLLRSSPMAAVRSAESIDSMLTVSKYLWQNARTINRAYTMHKQTTQAPSRYIGHSFYFMCCQHIFQQQIIAGWWARVQNIIHWPCILMKLSMFVHDAHLVAMYLCICPSSRAVLWDTKVSVCAEPLIASSTVTSLSTISLMWVSK